MQIDTDNSVMEIDSLFRKEKKNGQIGVIGKRCKFKKNLFARKNNSTLTQLCSLHTSPVVATYPVIPTLIGKRLSKGLK